MREQTAEFIEIVNKLKRATAEGKVLWERTGDYGSNFATSLDSGFRASILKSPSGGHVVFRMTNPAGVDSIHLDSSRVADDLLKLALLQLYVAVRDTVRGLMTRDALEALKDL